MNQTLNKSIKEKIIDNALAKAGIPQRKKALRADWAERVRLKSDMKQQTSFCKKCYSPLECYF